MLLVVIVFVVFFFVSYILTVEIIIDFVVVVIVFLCGSTAPSFVLMLIYNVRLYLPFLLLLLAYLYLLMSVWNRKERQLHNT